MAQTTVNPDILKWAREEMGMTIEDVAESLNFEITELKAWEKNGEGLTFSQLAKLAKKYKRQTAVFFLNETPPSTRIPTDFRNLAGVRGLFPMDTRLSIRRASRYLDIARELEDPSSLKKQYEWLKNFTGRKDQIVKEANAMRALLTSHSDKTFSSDNPEEAFRKWRKKVEDKLGIYVFQFKMPVDDISGFSYAFEEFPYAIVINKDHSAVKKNFTLFHEVAHILRHKPGVCKTDDVDEGRISEIEQDCNQFSGKMLAPRKLLKSSVDIEEVFRLGRALNISGEAYLHRLHEEKMITEDEFYDLLPAVREKSRNLPRRESVDEDEEFLIQQGNLSKSQRGGKFFELIASASAANRISYSTASDLLGIKLGYIKL